MQLGRSSFACRKLCDALLGAHAKGKHCGRKAKLSEGDMGQIWQHVAAGEEKKALAVEYGTSRQTLYRIIKG